MTVAAPAPASSHDEMVHVLGRDIAYKWVVAIVYISALFLDLLDTTIINVALPVMQSELHTTKVEWVVLGYTLSLAVWIPTSGWLGDRFGTKRTFLFALAAFTVGSAACGFAQSIGQLIAFRILQGVGGGMLTPVGIAMLFRAFPPAERAKASTVVMVPMLVAPALGPVLGGLITTHFEWRWIFWVNVPIAVGALWFGLRNLREHREPSAQGFDLAGFVLSGASLALVVFALSEGWQSGWTSPLVLGTGGGGLLCGALTVLVETRVSNPMLDLRLFGNRMFRTCNIVSFFSSASFLGVTFVMPLYLQNVRGLSPLASGLSTFPQALGVMGSSLIAGRLYARVGPRRLMAGGFFSATLAIALFISIDATTDLWLIRGLMLLRGFCMGFAFVPMQAASYATIPPAQNGRASSLFSTQRQVGISFGVAVLASILASFGAMTPYAFLSDVPRALAGVRWAFAAAVVVALIAAVGALFIRDEEAKATMAARARS
ncbi:MAG: MDR family MFS transporter [Actinomycetota bacterium]|nr:MDR family MFS transporter [Actinomycetota bacterium]